MFKKIENIAWLVLILSFITCIAAAVGTPMSVRWFIMNTTRPLRIIVQPRSGTVTEQEPGNNTSVLIAGESEAPLKSRIGLSDDADAVLLFYHPARPNAPMITAQLYGVTDLVIQNAYTPRFSMSNLSNHVELQVSRGSNIRVTVEENGRPTTLRIQTPQGAIDMDAGIYSLAVNQDRTEFSVSAGRAHIPDPATGETFILTYLQRTELTAKGVGEISVGERDILRNRNGSFDEPLEGTWQSYANAGVESEDGGNVRQVAVGTDDKIVLFTRAGQAHAETGIAQEINQDIRGAKSLRVRARVRVDAQTLGVCGSLGTECPVMIRINYTDQQSGSVREWLQGFYALDGTDQPFCQICEWKARHIKVAQLGVWYDYESPDLLPLLKEQGIEPATIQSVTIYASGHTYGSAIDEIAILVGE
jgi:hypothetical protein